VCLLSLSMCALCALASCCCTAPATSPIYPLSLHDALPIYQQRVGAAGGSRGRVALVRPGDPRAHAVGLGASQRTQDCPNLLASKDRKSTRLNSSHGSISYAVFCLKKTNLLYARLVLACPLL